MWFEGRELKSYAEPVSGTSLLENKVYFSLQFADEEMLVPIVQPVVFVGRNLVSGDEDLFYFQDFESYSMGSHEESASGSDPTAFNVRGRDDLKHIFEYERALESLMKCSLRRQDSQKEHR